MPRRKGHAKRRAEGVAIARESKRRKRESLSHSPSTSSEVGGSRSLTPPPATPPPPPATTSSAEKRLSIVKGMKREEVINSESIIIKQSYLDTIVGNVACLNCYESDISCVITRRYADNRLKIQCKKCKYVVIDNDKDSKVSGKVKGIFAVTSMLVYAVLLIGSGLNDFWKLCSHLGIRKIRLDVFVRHAEYIKKRAVLKTKEILAECHKAVSDYYKEHFADIVKDGLINIDVSYDGSWHTRGHTSHYFFGAVICAWTGYAVDYVTLCNFCEQCHKKGNLLKKKQMTPEKYEEWYENHAPNCEKNFDGTAAMMEVEGAEILWKRSVDIGFRYINFISDGDSKAYNSVTNLNDGEGPYGVLYPVEKHECVNHVAKRLGAHLRNLSKDWIAKTGNSLGGTGRLTAHVITELQLYFGKNIREKINTSVSEMRTCIMASLYHCSNKTHDICPKSEQSWCFYQRELAKGKSPSEIDVGKIRVSFTLKKDELEAVEKVYENLTDDKLLQKCLKGKTQNRNEHLHSIVWRILPKHKNTKRRYLDFAAAQAVGKYNVGYEESNLNKHIGVPYTRILHTYLQNADAKMILPIKKKMRIQVKQDSSYSPGGY